MQGMKPKKETGMKRVQNQWLGFSSYILNSKIHSLFHPFCIIKMSNSTNVSVPYFTSSDDTNHPTLFHTLILVDFALGKASKPSCICWQRLESKGSPH